MKKLLKFLTLLIGAGTLIFSCTREEPVMDWKYVHETEYFVRQAREFFENLIIEADEKGTLDLKSGLAPGEITPAWDNAYLYSDSKYDYALVDFIADYYYNVRETVIKDGEVVYRTFPVYQHLLVRKDKTSGDMGAAYVTLTPNRLYNIKHRKNVSDNFFKKENRGDYKGLLFFYDVVTMQLLTAEKYEDGARVSGVYYNECSSFEEFATAVLEYLKNYIYLRYSDIMTRNDGESSSGSGDNGNNNGNNNGGDNGGDENLPPPGYDSGIGTEENPIPVPPAGVTPPGGDGWNGSEDPFKEPDPGEDTGGLPIGGGGKGLKTYIRNDKDKFFREDFIRSFPKQSGVGTCAANSLAYIDQTYGGARTEADIIQLYKDATGNDYPTINGLHYLYVIALAETLFTVYSIEFMPANSDQKVNSLDFDSALNSGHVILTNVDDHSVTVVGKTHDGKYICMDPADGKLKEGSRETFGSHYEIAI